MPAQAVNVYSLGSYSVRPRRRAKDTDSESSAEVESAGLVPAPWGRIFLRELRTQAQSSSSDDGENTLQCGQGVVVRQVRVPGKMRSGHQFHADALFLRNGATVYAFEVLFTPDTYP